uniref:Uncharacterized protein n=1 Tax=Gasterosteus aculeatus TaxID=69293 RepID=G3QCK9_GASAC
MSDHFFFIWVRGREAAALLWCLVGISDPHCVLQRASYFSFPPPNDHLHFTLSLVVVAQPPGSVSDSSWRSQSQRTPSPPPSRHPPPDASGPSSRTHLCPTSCGSHSYWTTRGEEESGETEKTTLRCFDTDATRNSPRCRTPSCPLSDGLRPVAESLLSDTAPPAGAETRSGERPR